MNESNSGSDPQSSNEEGLRILRKKTWMTGIQSLLAGGFLLAVHWDQLTILDMEVHWSLTVIVSVALAFNLLAFALNVRMLRTRSEEDSLMKALQGSGETAKTESYMDDPEVKELMDRVVKKSKSLK